MSISLKANSDGTSGAIQINGTDATKIVASGVLGLGGPAFSASSSGNTTAANTTETKIMFDTEEYDNSSCFNNTGATVGGIPSYSFLPNVAGWYQVNANIQYPGTTYSGGLFILKIFKNGTQYNELGVSIGTQYIHLSGGILVYLNGTTDYINLYGTQQQGTSQPIRGTIFSAFLVKAT